MDLLESFVESPIGDFEVSSPKMKCVSRSSDRQRLPLSHNCERNIYYRYLSAMAIGLLCFASTTHSYQMDASRDHVKSFDNNYLGGDMDLFKITWPGNIVFEDVPDLNTELRIDALEHVPHFHIATKDNERYICLDPPLSNKNEMHSDFSARNSSSEKSKSPLQLLEPLLKGNSCSYKFDLFWIYELCHGRYLRQYHEENGRQKAKVTQEYYLGKMDNDQIELQEEEYEKEMAQQERLGQSRPTILVNGVYKPYVVVTMSSGTKCDITKRNRVSRIVYVCNEEPSLELYSIKEISTCEYEAIVLSPHLCRHKDFKIDTATQHEIKCYAISKGAPAQPKRIKEFHTEDEEDKPKSEKFGHKRRGIAYLHGRTLIIDADLLLS